MRAIDIAFLILFVALIGCQEKPTNADGSRGKDHPPVGNLPPVTHLFLIPDSTGLDTSASVIEVYWWGEDLDGWVVGYFVQWDYFGESALRDSIWLTVESATFYLPLDSAYDEFQITVKAVDNSALWYWPWETKIAEAEGGTGLVTAGILDYVELEAFLDDGSDPGVYDPQDSLLWEGNIEGMQTATGTPLVPLYGGDPSPHLLPPTEAMGAMDLDGATLTFPIRNTPPVVDFRIETNPSLPSGHIYRSFPTRSFFWEVTDLDGNETVDSCFYALDPDSADTAWVRLPGTQTFVTLEDLSPGYHRFFLKVQDIANAQSPTIRFPETDSSFWEVMEPTGDFLLVDDYALDASNNVLSFYQSIFDTLAGIEGQYSVWEIGSNLPYATSDVIATLNYFDRVFWYSFYGFSNYMEALNAIMGFLDGGGAVLISALQVDTTSGVLPVSAYEPGLLRVGPPNGFAALLEGWPDLILSESFSNEIFGLAASENGELLYEIGPGAQWPAALTGVSVRRTDGLKLIFIDMPLHILNGAGTLPEFLDKVFNEEFQ